jgi:hypothetical protein
MKVSEFCAKALATGLAAALLSACAIAQNNLVPPGTVASRSEASRGSWMLPDAKNSTLIYVTGWLTPYVYAYAYPSGSLEGTLHLKYNLQSLCSDDRGNVWVPTNTSTKGFIFKIKHAGTKPIETLTDRQLAGGCAVDESTGNLAVIGNLQFTGSNYGYGGVAIYPGGHGKPAYYSLPVAPFSCSYDDRGDLFVVTWSGYPSDHWSLIWLPKGASGFEGFSLSPNVTPYGVRWDGKYLAVAVGVRAIDRFQIDSTDHDGSKVGQTVHIADAGDPWADGLWWIADGKLFATYTKPSTRNHDDFSAWSYPRGGKPVKVVAGPSRLWGITVSKK